VPEAGLLFDQCIEWIPDATTRQRILVNNPAKLYGF
jgi:2-pyrone-4,6-dicarboxylate lactonase